MYQLKPGWTKQQVLERFKKYNNGTRATYNPEDAKSSCAYKAPDGNRCAAGVFFPEAHIALSLGGSIRYVLKRYPELVDHMPLDADGMSRMQCVHDATDRYPYDDDLRGYATEPNTHKRIERFLETEVEHAE